ncbi:hypothetical protein L6452_28331 [Arctium lappa]|uniref:Uncharacterized protein n=1 Tax=Arctium lappa TaxID=4217 RepID=A0ACB8ZXL1_ARCLA|nr:hypothetical protein L6452_28331 [Arctium lappa]
MEYTVSWYTPATMTSDIAQGNVAWFWKIWLEGSDFFKKAQVGVKSRFSLNLARRAESGCAIMSDGCFGPPPFGCARDVLSIGGVSDLVYEEQLALKFK